MQGRHSTLNKRVWRLTRKIPSGKVTTYKEIAHSLGTKAYRAVGNALHVNPYAPTVPCHRVVNSNGSVGGFASGTRKKMQMLKKEGITIKKNKIDLKKYLYRP
jgi:methylated-DNA-[protein]-cysteine S-methyltransferase